MHEYHALACMLLQLQRSLVQLSTYVAATANKQKERLTMALSAEVAAYRLTNSGVCAYQNRYELLPLCYAIVTVTGIDIAVHRPVVPRPIC